MKYRRDSCNYYDISVSYFYFNAIINIRIYGSLSCRTYDARAFIHLPIGCNFCYVRRNYPRLSCNFINHHNDVKNRLRKEDTLRNQTSLKFALLSKWKHLLSKIFSISRFGYRYIWIIVSVFILAIWHVPSIFDFASQHIQVHILQHISFIIVGATGFLAIRSFGESFNLFLLMSMMCMMCMMSLPAYYFR